LTLISITWDKGPTCGKVDGSGELIQTEQSWSDYTYTSL